MGVSCLVPSWKAWTVLSPIAEPGGKARCMHRLGVGILPTVHAPGGISQQLQGACLRQTRVRTSFRSFLSSKGSSHWWFLRCSRPCPKLDGPFWRRKGRQRFVGVCASALDGEMPLLTAAAAIGSAAAAALSLPVSVMRASDRGNAAMLSTTGQDFLLLCKAQLELAARLLGSSTTFTVFVRTPESYATGQLELQEVAGFPTKGDLAGMPEANDVVALVGPLGDALPRDEAEQALLQHESVELPERRALVLPLIRDTFLVGLLVLQRAQANQQPLAPSLSPSSASEALPSQSSDGTDRTPQDAIENQRQASHYEAGSSIARQGQEAVTRIVKRQSAGRGRRSLALQPPPLRPGEERATKEENQSGTQVEEAIPVHKGHSNGVAEAQERGAAFGGAAAAAGEHKSVFSQEEREVAISIARTLAAAAVLDQRASLLQQATWQRGVRLDGLLEQVRAPLTAIRTLGKMLLPQLRKGEVSRDIAEDMVVQGDRMKEVVGQLRNVVSSQGPPTIQTLPLDDSPWTLDPPLPATPPWRGRLEGSQSSEGGEALKRLEGGSFGEGTDGEAVSDRGGLSSNGGSTHVENEGRETSRAVACLPLAVQGVVEDKDSTALVTLQQSCDLLEILQQLVSASQPLAKQRQFTLELVSPPPGTLPFVAADAFKMRQLLSIVLDNAIRFIAEGGWVHVETRECETGGVLLVVEDDGAGPLGAAQIPGHLSNRRDLSSEGEASRLYQTGLEMAKDQVERLEGVLRIRSTGLGVNRLELWLPTVAQGRQEAVPVPSLDLEGVLDEPGVLLT